MGGKTRLHWFDVEEKAMLETLLVPLDGSAGAEIALPFATGIAARARANLVLATAALPDARDLTPLYHSYLERARKLARVQLKKAGAENAKIYVHVLPGAPAEAILRYADEAGAGLVVMARRGADTRGPWLLGGVVSKVVRASLHPVLVVTKAAAAGKSISKILIPLDGSPAGESALLVAEELARTLGSELVLYHAVEPVASWAGYAMGADYPVGPEPVPVPDDAPGYLAGVRRRLAAKGLEVSAVTEEGLPAELILNYARKHGVDLIALATHGRTGVGRWVLGSVTEKVISYAETAILVAHTGARA
jgi:nucleotide-binding universal stress UspA family protein